MKANEKVSEWKKTGGIDKNQKKKLQITQRCCKYELKEGIFLALIQF